MCQTDQTSPTKNTKESIQKSAQVIYTSPSLLRSLMSIRPSRPKSKLNLQSFLKAAGICVPCWNHTAHIVCMMLLLFSPIGSCKPAFAEIGTASFYGNGEKLNKRTANGDIFNPKALTAASYHFPIGSYVKCRSLRTGKSVTVRINDKGPNKRLGRLIDLTKNAFSKIDDKKNGLTKVVCHEI